MKPKLIFACNPDGNLLKKIMIDAYAAVKDLPPVMIVKLIS